MRPTSVYGPMHEGLSNGLFKQIMRGRYIHPRGQVLRSFGYVENVNWQIIKLLSQNDLKQEVFYVGDELIDQGEWDGNFTLNCVVRR